MMWLGRQENYALPEGRRRSRRRQEPPRRKGLQDRLPGSKQWATLSLTGLENLYHVAVGNPVNMVPGQRMNQRVSCHRPERGQSCMCAREVETGQCNSFRCDSVQLDCRVNMSRQRIAVWRRSREVLKHKRGFDRRRIDAADFEFGWRIAGVSIVITSNEQYVQERMPRAPILEGSQGSGSSARARVKGVSEQYDAFCPGPVNDCRQTRKICFRSPGGNRDGGRPHRRSFTAMYVGNEQCGPARPEYRPFGKQRQRLRLNTNRKVSSAPHISRS